MSDLPGPRRAIVVADGDVPTGERLADRLPRTGDHQVIVIAADGGLRKAELLGLMPEVVVGDADSLAPEAIAGLAERGIELLLHPSAKDASDTELALREAVRRGATQITVLGALGGLRFEHSLANVLALTLPELDGVDVTLVDAVTSVRLATPAKSVVLAGRAGDLVSLLPLSDSASGVRTQGLRYALDGHSLAQGPSLGLSNEMLADEAQISLQAGRLAVIHTSLGERGNA